MTKRPDYLARRKASKKRYRDKNRKGASPCKVCGTSCPPPAQRRYCSEPCRVAGKRWSWTGAKQKAWYETGGGREWHREYAGVVAREGYRSGFERIIAEDLTRRGVEFTYELKQFNKAIYFLQLCLNVDETHTEALKVLALSLKAVGKEEMALATLMKSAVFFKVKGSPADWDRR